MTVSATTRKAGPYTGNGATTVFSFAFKVFAASELVVTVADLTGTETVKTLTTHYTVSLNADQDANPGGSITMLTALTTGYLLTVTSNVALSQSVTLTQGGAFYPSVISTALDRVTILTQQLDEQMSRTLKVGVTSGTAPDPASIAAYATAAQASASAAAASASTASTAAGNLPNATTGGANVYIKTDGAGTGWTYKTVANLATDVGSVATAWTKPQTVAPYALTTSTTWDGSTYQQLSADVNGAIFTIAAASAAPANGTYVSLFVKYTTTHAVAFTTGAKGFSGISTFTGTSTAGKYDHLVFRYDSTADRFMLVGYRLDVGV